MRWLTLTLISLIVALQYPLWFGKGSWTKVWSLDTQVITQKQKNDTLKERNHALEVEVNDLKQGYDAIEERARSELGMVRRNEIFFQVLEDGSSKSVSPSPSKTK